MSSLISQLAIPATLNGLQLGASQPLTYYYDMTALKAGIPVEVHRMALPNNTNFYALGGYMWSDQLKAGSCSYTTAGGITLQMGQGYQAFTCSSPQLIGSSILMAYGTSTSDMVVADNPAMRRCFITLFVAQNYTPLNS